MTRRLGSMGLLALVLLVSTSASGQVARARDGMVVSQNEVASKIGADVLREGGNAVDAAVATAFALAVTHPTAGNLGGGGFIVFRSGTGETDAYDFRETAPAKAAPTMFIENGRYSERLHHDSYLSVGVPGTVAGLHLAWKERGKLPWMRLVEPAVALARDGFVVTDGLARSLRGVLPSMKRYPAALAQFSKNGVPYEPGERLRQPDLARTLRLVAERGPAGFYEGEVAALLERDMAANGGLITRADMKAYRAKKRTPLVGRYRGHDIISMPPISSGGVALIEMLNILEGYDVKSLGFRSAASVHLIAEAMRRAFADRARHLGDPDFNPGMPVERLVSKEYAAALRQTISARRASKSSPDRFEWPAESDETTHLSVVDADRNAVALTYTLENGYGAKIVAPGTGFLLNDEMGDFNAGPGLTTASGLIGTAPNLSEPGKRMVSSMTPTIVAREGALVMVTGSPGGRTIINTVLHTILNVVDHGMSPRAAVDAPRFHHQWLPDRIVYERWGLSPDTVGLLEGMGHSLDTTTYQGVAEVIVVDPKEGLLEGAADNRAPDGAAIGVTLDRRR
jgi:gamma-glutamyltranspeptidase/glutathione hydrolase